MKYTIEIVQGKNGKWYYKIIGGNHKIAATSQQYTSKYNAKRAVCYLLSVKDNVHYIQVEDVTLAGKSILADSLHDIHLERKKKE